MTELLDNPQRKCETPTKKYSHEVRNQAARPFQEHAHQYPSRWAAMQSIAAKIDCTAETLRSWVASVEAAADPHRNASLPDRERVEQLEWENLELRRANENLCKASASSYPGGARLPREVLIAFTGTHRAEYGIDSIYEQLPITPSPYYEHKSRQVDPSRLPPRGPRDGEVTGSIHRLWEEIFRAYGARKVWRQLRRGGIPVARCTIKRLMHRHGLCGAVRGRKKRTTFPEDVAERRLDRVHRQFVATRPNGGSCGLPILPMSPRGWVSCMSLS